MSVNRYILFMFPGRSAQGGLNDVVGRYPTLEEVEQAACNAAKLDRSLTDYQIGMETTEGIKLLTEGEIIRETIITLTKE